MFTHSEDMWGEANVLRPWKIKLCLEKRTRLCAALTVHLSLVDSWIDSYECMMSPEMLVMTLVDAICGNEPSRCFGTAAPHLHFNRVCIEAFATCTATHQCKEHADGFGRPALIIGQMKGATGSYEYHQPTRIFLLPQY